MDQQEIVARIEQRAQHLGLSISEVCRRAGLHPTTFSRWKRSDRNPKPIGANLASIERLNAILDAAKPVSEAAA